MLEAEADAAAVLAWGLAGGSNTCSQTNADGATASQLLVNQNVLLPT
jgi:hypothetical protein